MLPPLSLARLVIYFVAIFIYPTVVTSSYSALPSQLYKARHASGVCVNCSTTIHGLNRSVWESIQIERIKQQIIKGLGLDRVPDLTHGSADHQPNNTKPPVTNPPIDTGIEIYPYIDIISKSEPPDGINDKSVLQFKVQEKGKDENVRVHRGYLYVFLKKRGRRSKGNKRITLRISTVDERGKPKKLLTSLKMRLKESKWQKIGLPSDLLNQVLKNPNHPLKLHIRCKKCKKGVKPILVLKSSRSGRKTRRGRPRKQPRNRKPCLNKNRPLLVIQTKTLRTRSKRHTLSCVRGNGQHVHPHNTTFPGGNACCKRSYYLNFTEIGWGDWIISPEGTIVSECEGRCGNRRSSSLEDVMTSRQTSGRGRRQRNRQCRPTRTAPLLLVYFDESLHVVQKRIRDMTVTSCGCRAGN